MMFCYFRFALSLSFVQVIQQAVAVAFPQFVVEVGFETAIHDVPHVVVALANVVLQALVQSCDTGVGRRDMQA
jgi:hypothetical protein